MDSLSLQARPTVLELEVDGCGGGIPVESGAAQLLRDYESPDDARVGGGLSTVVASLG